MTKVSAEGGVILMENLSLPQVIPRNVLPRCQSLILTDRLLSPRLLTTTIHAFTLAGLIRRSKLACCSAMTLV
ncbi:hypothetical protein FRC03_000221 [Tulasnella sp. 419]|nr:hypothetical protein FRC03_000221 [Tulasnella sp. 419]